MKPTQEQINNFDKKYKEIRATDWNLLVREVNEKMRENQEAMVARGLKKYTFRWAYETHKGNRRIFKGMNMNYLVQHSADFKNFGFWAGMRAYLAYLLSAI